MAYTVYIERYDESTGNLEAKVLNADRTPVLTAEGQPLRVAGNVLGGVSQEATQEELRRAIAGLARAAVGRMQREEAAQAQAQQRRAHIKATLPEYIEVCEVPAAPVVTEPAAGATVTNPVRVRGTVDANAAQVLVNGVKAALSLGDFQADVTLPEGTETLTVTASNELGDESHATIHVMLGAEEPEERV